MEPGLFTSQLTYKLHLFRRTSITVQKEELLNMLQSDFARHGNHAGKACDKTGPTQSIAPRKELITVASCMWHRGSTKGEAASTCYRTWDVTGRGPEGWAGLYSARVTWQVWTGCRWILQNHNFLVKQWTSDNECMGGAALESCIFSLQSISCNLPQERANHSPLLSSEWLDTTSWSQLAVYRLRAMWIFPIKSVAW